MLATLLAACATPGLQAEGGVHILSARPGGTQLSLLPAPRSPVLVVKSPKGLGSARLEIRQPLPEGLTIEFPGLRQLEQVSLSDGSRTLTCRGGQELRSDCSWGERWPVGQLQRHDNGLTLSLPGELFTQPGRWSLEWVDYWRH
ncbi:MAG TPA: hypothetical protein VF050_06115 [Moraxellaceae bacterium]